MLSDIQNVSGNLTTGAISYNQRLDSAAGNFSLDVDTAGTTTFAGVVGTDAVTGSGAGGLGGIDTDAGGTTAINTTTVTTLAATGDQVYNDAVLIGANATLSGNDITFVTTLDADDTAMDRTLDIVTSNSGVTTFGGQVGNTTGQLESLTTDTTVANDGRTDIDTDLINVDGASVTFNDPVRRDGRHRHHHRERDRERDLQ